ncbi:RHS repeat-associated core domain-containing protein [Pseudoduganella sp. HUAS MS19]
MAHETVTKSKRFYCVSLSPDLCKTPVGSSVAILPYNIKGEFKDAANVSSNVKTHGEPVLLHNKSFIPSIKGDERGTLGGIKSQTYLKRAQPMEFSSTKGSNGAQTIQESRLIYMNDKNTVGRIYERQVQAPRARLTILGVELPTLKEAAQEYRDKYSEPLHQFGNNAMDVGGKIGAGSAALGVAGVGVAATGIGAPAAAVMEVGAAAGGTTAAVVSGTGLAADSSARLLDNAADYILTGKSPDVLATVGGIAVNAVENFALKKLSSAGSFLKRFFNKKEVPGKATPPPKKPPAEDKSGGGKGDGRDGGKTKKEKPQKQDKPASCCPKDMGPANKSATSTKPVHFGTGEEILYQEDFVLDGPTPIVWGRTYRSGSETEDWSMIGARWTLSFNSSVSVCQQGIVYHDASGRCVRLPTVAIGGVHDHCGEGFVLRRDSESAFTLTWRDGSTDTFQRGPDGILPHGYQGVNAMLKPQAPMLTQRYYLVRAAAPSGRGISIERFHDARPGELLLRAKTDEGLRVEAIRASLMPGESDIGPRVGRVEQILEDGSRLCHVRYEYEPEEAEMEGPDAPGSFTSLPQRFNLVRQSNILNVERTYAYKYSLLTACTNYTGFAYGLEWVSLAQLRERWAGSSLSDIELRQRNPISQDNSYSARAVRTTTADGLNEVVMEYRDIDTTIVTEANGGKLEYRFDHNWLITEVRRLDVSGMAVSLGKREWDKDGKLLADIDGAGNATRYTYDASGNLATVTDALGHVTSRTYNAQNRLISETNALGHSITKSYDGQGNLCETTDALGRSTRYRYDAGGRLTTVIDARGGTKRLIYDSAGRLAAHIDCSQQTTEYRYDQCGRLTQVNDATGYSTTYRYNQCGHLIEVMRRDGGLEKRNYDYEGRLTEYVDPKGQRTRYTYNGHGMPIERIDAKGQVMRYRYDNALRLIELVNGNDESYHLTYDAEGRLASETGFDGKKTAFTYDRAGHLIAREVAGQRTTFARDSIGQLDAIVSIDGSVRYAHDALGNLTALRNSAADLRFAYDAAGQLIDERVAYALNDVASPEEAVEYTVAFTMNHAYDELGNRIQTILPNGRKLSTQRYGSGHWHGTLWNGMSIVDVERDELHRETERMAGGGKERMRTEKHYDPQSRLKAVTLHKGQQLLHSQKYSYDLAGHLSEVNDALRGVTRYTYDPIGQLRSAVQPGLTELFDFDPAGNLLDGASEDSARPMQDQPIMEMARPRLPKVTHDLLRHYMDFAYEYDVQGNTVLKSIAQRHSANDAGDLILAYDAESRLVRSTRKYVTGAASTTLYRYDGFGRRISKRVLSDTGNSCTSEAITYYVWDGDVLFQEVQDNKSICYLYEPDSFIPLALIETSEGSKDYVAANAFLAPIDTWRIPEWPGDAASHLAAWRQHQMELEEARHQARRSARCQLASDLSATDRIYHYTCDQLGTPLKLHREDGALAWAASYRAWGRTLREDVHVVNQPLRFQGQYFDEESGLHYNRFRYYDPDTARYLTPDPIRLAGGVNLHQYAANPTGWIDPLGLARIKGITPNNKGTRTTIEGGKGMSEATTGYSQRAGGNGASHPVVRDLYDAVPEDQRSVTHSWCGETDALSKIATAHNVESVEQLGSITSGATTETTRNDGKLMECCSSCAHVTKRLNIRDKLKD